MAGTSLRRAPPDQNYRCLPEFPDTLRKRVGEHGAIRLKFDERVGKP